MLGNFARFEPPPSSGRGNFNAAASWIDPKSLPRLWTPLNRGRGGSGFVTTNRCVALFSGFEIKGLRFAVIRVSGGFGQAEQVARFEVGQFHHRACTVDI